jgi:hypothetical protein
MLFSALGSIGSRLDSKFITAYFAPAFVAVLGTLWILVVTTGSERFGDWIEQLDSVEQAIGVLVLLLVTSMLGHVLQALARPIAQLFAGRAWPEPFRRPLIENQRRARARARLKELLSRGDRLYPRDSADTAPTAFGNVLTAAADYPRLVYAMDPYHWWLRLLPLLPVEFQEMLRSIETPMRAMLNFSLVSLYLGCLGAVVLGLVEKSLLTAVIFLVGGVVAADLFYRAAITQATELARNIWVGFDLYRSEILKQLNEAIPTSLEEERALWPRLARRLRELEEQPLETTADVPAQPSSAEA